MGKLSTEERHILRYEVLPSLEEERDEVEATLLERTQGPFVEIEDYDVWAEDLKKRGRERLLAKRQKHA